MIQGYPGLFDGWEEDETLGFGMFSNVMLPNSTVDMAKARPRVHKLGMVNYQQLLKPEFTAEYREKLKDNVMLFNLKGKTLFE